MNPEATWLAVKPLADANLPLWIRAIQADAVKDIAECLKKYQARYHGAAHAKQDWEKSDAALKEVRHLL